MWWSTSCAVPFNPVRTSRDCCPPVARPPGDPSPGRPPRSRTRPPTPMIRQHLVPIEQRSEWDEALDGVGHAFAHTWLNCHAMQRTTGWPTFLWVLEDGDARAVLPFAERGASGSLDAVTPYGWGGFAGAAANS